MDALEKLLAELQTEYQQTKPVSPQPQQNIAKPSIPASPKSLSLIDGILDEVKADFIQQDQAEELRKQQELAAEKIRQAQLKAKQQEALKTSAKEWLNKLDPFSPEGLWFERFAEGYPSKLAAAIEYLQTN
ncbi:salt stress protein, Slr1339 family [Fortiea contorta]|uniref:salt stress protein, Slr1339 family n=1 Tax=Fortiea contorta TaxID=1892405 RepID=UPI000349CBBF|nr:hypothetical protein [Fortiea contorta]